MQLKAHEGLAYFSDFVAGENLVDLKSGEGGEMGQSIGSEVEATRDNDSARVAANPETRFEASKRESRNDAAGAGGRARTGDATRDAA